MIDFKIMDLKSVELINICCFNKHFFAKKKKQKYDIVFELCLLVLQYCGFFFFKEVTSFSKCSC